MAIEVPQDANRFLFFDGVIWGHQGTDPGGVSCWITGGYFQILFLEGTIPPSFQTDHRASFQSAQRCKLMIKRSGMWYGMTDCLYTIIHPYYLLWQMVCYPIQHGITPLLE